MSNDKNLKAALSKAPIESISIDDIAALDELQMRRPDVLSDKARSNEAEQREALIDSISESLKADPEFESPSPLKIVVCLPEDEENFGQTLSQPRNCLVDGFHRLAGYKKAGRVVVPVQRVEGTWKQALDVATIYNHHTQTVAPDKDQKRQQAWEMVNRHLDHESGKIGNGWSARKIGRDLGVNHQTVNNMVQRALKLGKSANTMLWKDARSDWSPEEVSEFARTKGLVKRTLEFISKANGEQDLEVVMKVIQDELSGKLGYNPDVDEYTERLLKETEAEEVLEF